MQYISEKHSQFSTTYPIYIMQPATKTESTSSDGEDEEDAAVDEGAPVDEWARLNEKGPIWMR